MFIAAVTKPIRSYFPGDRVCCKSREELMALVDSGHAEVDQDSTAERLSANPAIEQPIEKPKSKKG